MECIEPVVMLEDVAEYIGRAARRPVPFELVAEQERTDNTEELRGLFGSSSLDKDLLGNIVEPFGHRLSCSLRSHQGSYYRVSSYHIPSANSPSADTPHKCCRPAPQDSAFKVVCSASSGAG